MRHGPPVLFLLLGLALVISTAWSMAGTASFIRHAERASGRVVEAGAGGRHPAVTFQTAAGQTIRFQGGGLIGSVSQGQTVAVLYATYDPARTARIGGTISLFFMPAIVGAIGAVFAVVALLALRRRSA